MKAPNLRTRILNAGMRVKYCKYRVVAVGFDRVGNLIGIKTNAPRLQARGWHAEERLIHSLPRSLGLIRIARLGAAGDFMPIDPCEHCMKIARERGIQIERY